MDKSRALKTLKLDRMISIKSIALLIACLHYSHYESSISVSVSKASASVPSSVYRHAVNSSQHSGGAETHPALSPNIHTKSVPIKPHLMLGPMILFHMLDISRFEDNSHPSSIWVRVEKAHLTHTPC